MFYYVFRRRELYLCFNLWIYSTTGERLRFLHHRDCETLLLDKFTVTFAYFFKASSIKVRLFCVEFVFKMPKTHVVYGLDIVLCLLMIFVEILSRRRSEVTVCTYYM